MTEGDELNNPHVEVIDSRTVTRVQRFQCDENIVPRMQAQDLRPRVSQPDFASALNALVHGRRLMPFTP